MTHPGRVLVFDGGRSGCRARLREPSGEVAESSGPAVPYVRGPQAVARIQQALDEAAAALTERGVDVVVAGLAGVFEHREIAAPLATSLAAATSARRVVVTGDLVTSFAGALGRADGAAALVPGVVVAAGTGAVAFGVGADGTTARANGWGYLLGDEGSGYWIGRAGLAAALAHEDDRGGSGALHTRAEARFGPVVRLAELVYGSDAPAGLIASFAPAVADAARAGDPVAEEIWRDAAHELARSAAAAARVLEDGRGALSYTGGLFRSGLLLEPMQQELARRCPGLDVRPPAGSALDGAELLAAIEPLPASLGHTHHVH